MKEKDTPISVRFITTVNQSGMEHEFYYLIAHTSNGDYTWGEAYVFDITGEDSVISYLFYAPITHNLLKRFMDEMVLRK